MQAIIPSSLDSQLNPKIDMLKNTTNSIENTYNVTINNGNAKYELMRKYNDMYADEINNYNDNISLLQQESDDFKLIHRRNMNVTIFFVILVALLIIIFFYN